MPPNPRRERTSTTKLNSDTAPESPSKGSDSERLSISPQSIRHGGADVFDLGEGEVQKDAGEFNYDKNTLPTGVEPGAVGPGSSPRLDVKFATSCSSSARFRA
jgi:hypothetical protein